MFLNITPLLSSCVISALLFVSQLTTVFYYDRVARLPATRADGLDLLHDVHAVRNRAKDAVFAVEPIRLDSAQKELTSVSIGTGVGHREHARTFMTQLEVLVFEAADRKRRRRIMGAYGRCWWEALTCK